MAVKSSIILAMLLWLVAYAQSQSISEAGGFSLRVCKNALSRAGYVETEQSHQPSGRLVEIFELRTPSRPHYHFVWQIELTSRHDRVVDINYDGSDTQEFRD